MDYLNLYAKFLRKHLKLKHSLKVIFDCSNGTTGLVIKKLRNLVIGKLKTVLINDKPDGNFPAHGPNPMLKGALNDLQKSIKKHKADLGIVFDADGDRVFFVDDRGRVVNPDIVAVLISKNYKGPVILDLRTGYLARELIAADGKKVINSRVGHYFIKKLMRQKRINFAGELSGHYYFKNFFFADSGILGAIQIINQVSKFKTKNVKLSDWIDILPKYYNSGELNFKITDVKFKNADDAKKFIMRKVEKKYQKQAKKVSHLDGLKMEFSSLIGDWWFNLRLSQTEDLLRLNLEAKNKKTFETKLAELKKLIQIH